MPGIPDKPSLDGLDERWSAVWEEQGTFRFDRTQDRGAVFSIDTPPPTVSGELHVGHVFSYTHTDTVARYQRMRGREVFYPMGWDDNGLPTERRAQRLYGVRCDPSLPYDPSFTPPTKPDEKKPISISRPNFLELCAAMALEDEKKFEELWRRLALSVDWSMTYTTIGDIARLTSQRAFLRNLARGEAYQADAPTLWDVDYRTAVAQAELEDKDMPGAYHALRFHKADGSGDILIDTTRPELLAACVALVAHPDDERYRPLFGSEVLTPLYGARVPIVAHRLADPEKGTGIAMICTFGDTTDVTWWRELQLPTRAIVGRDGRIKPEAPDSVSAEGRAAYEVIAGKTVRQAQKAVVEQLQESGEINGEPRPIQHPVKFYERGERPLEIVTSKQWYIRNGGRDPELRAQLIERGRELNWVPPFMRARYETWIEGLNGDWLISRQRFFGVPFPIWYRLDDAGEVVEGDAGYLLPDDASLPVDPSTDCPPGFAPEQRKQPGGFVADGDVMDTWATSSLTPEIVCRWATDDDLFARTFPMDLRPQAHEIIRTWLFSTIVRSHLELGVLPWKNAAISGWVIAEHGKISKSKGGAKAEPHAWMDTFGPDGVRYWATSGRPGTDTAIDEGQLRNGRKLAIKILNASKFVLGVAGDADDAVDSITNALDQSMLAQLAALIDECTVAFDGFDYARVLERTERFFWVFCDNYVELVKNRAYGDTNAGDARSAQNALRIALSSLLRLFAPFLVYVTEEVWSWWQEGSIHRAQWPTAHLGVAEGDPLVYAVAADVLAEVRKAKSEQKRSLATPVERVVVRDTAERLAALAAAQSDVCEAGKIAALDTEEGPELLVKVQLATE